MTIHESTAAYLLNALPDDERAEFEAHLSGCEACRHEVQELSVATASLPIAVEQVAAPPDLKNRIMATVSSEAELLAAAGAGADRVPARAAAPGARRWLGAWRPGLALAAAFACVLAIGVSAGLFASRDGGRDARQVVAQTAPKGARVVMDIREGQSTLTARDLPAPPSGRVYQVWIKRPSRDPEPTDALFTTRNGSASVSVPGDMDGVEAVLVTHEPKGGSKVPSVSPLIAIVPS